MEICSHKRNTQLKSLNVVWLIEHQKAWNVSFFYLNLNQKNQKAE